MFTINFKCGIDSPPFEIPTDIRERLIASLDNWNFEPHKLPDEEVLYCTMLLFEVLFRIEGMDEAVGISINQISGFLRHLRTIYRCQNSYHNFQHALDVLQATQMFLCAAGRVPPMSILLPGDGHTWRPDKTAGSELLIDCTDNLDVFTLYIAAIGHDVGHPGFTNKNAQAPLSVIYDDKSALEQMHYTLLLQLMRHNGLGELLDRPQTGIRVRKLLSAVVLATDMSVHAQFMENFTMLVDGIGQLPVDRTTLVCQALIKCADISNPSRPHGVSQHWASALSEEWSLQVQLEEHFHLPSTVKPATNPLAEAKSQIYFITTFAKPLIDITAKAIPQLERFANQCTYNLQTWGTRAAEITAASDGGLPDVPNALLIQPGLPEDFFTAFPMALPFHLVAPDLPAEPSRWGHRPDPSSSSSICSEISHSQSDTLSPNLSTTALYAPGSPALPSPSDSIGSSLFSLRSEQFLSGTPQRPPSASSCNTNGNSDVSTSIRAAYQAQASMRKKRSINNRNSWNPMSYRDPISNPPNSPRLQDTGPVSTRELLHAPLASPIRTVSLDA
ncbi:hypothetical protein HWV62_20946 [Athelia sp. TMB]|nr:hypothetical protein HWV62_20946 [Athelia sp. TMB]